MLRKVISGGQTGSDMAGLLAAKACGLETGGWCPRGYKTENGPRPALAKLGLKETVSEDYLPRTELNVRESDATLIIAMDNSSRGTKMTQKYCDDNRKVVIGCGFFTNNPPDVETTARNVANWIIEQNIGVLNVAGNRESVGPGIQTWSTKMLIRAFQMLEE
jgi:hypothetical protein